MDSTEQWLAANDPEYAKTSQKWRHVTTGDYRGPREEIPSGDTVDLDMLASAGGRLVEHGALGERLCWVCQAPFQPRKSDHRTCSEICRAQARRDYINEYRRQSRRAA